MRKKGNMLVNDPTILELKFNLLKHVWVRKCDILVFKDKTPSDQYFYSDDSKHMTRHKLFFTRTSNWGDVNFGGRSVAHVKGR